MSQRHIKGRGEKEEKDENSKVDISGMYVRVLCNIYYINQNK